jgi:phage shock protein A
VFGFFKKKDKASPRPADPLEAFDAVVESMERQGEELRRSAATLLALKAQFARDEVKYAAQQRELEARIIEAASLGDARAETVLRRDQLETQRRLDETLKARAQAVEDAELLSEAAREHASKLSDLKDERQRAKARLSAGLVVSEALQAQVEEVDRVLKLDRARDEIERAHALADIYREDAAKKRLRDG